MKELSLDEIRSALSTLGDSWLTIQIGEASKFKIISRTLYFSPANEPGLDGSTSEFDRWQTKIIDKDGVTRILKVQSRLAKAMLSEMDEHNLEFEKHFKDSEWYAERIDQFNWRGELLDWTGRSSSTVTQQVPQQSIAQKKLPQQDIPTRQVKEKPKLDVRGNGFSAKAKIMHDLIIANKLNEKQMTSETLKMISTSLTSLSLDDATACVDELIQKNVIKVVDGNIEWLV